MVDLAYSIIFFIVAIGVLITFHEYGHFWVARRCNVLVLKFSVGFGPKLFSYYSEKSCTEYVIAAIPLGGYVRMLDETRDIVSERLQPFAFNRKSLLQRTAVVAAGPLANFLLAILLFWCVYMIGIAGIKPVVGTVVPGSMSEQAGFAVGDEVQFIDGERHQVWEQHQLYLLEKAMRGEAVEFEVLSADGQRKLIVLDFGILEENQLNEEGGLYKVMGIFPMAPLVQPILGEVVQGGAADEAGLQAGDQIIQVAGEPVESWNQLVRHISEAPNQPLNITYWRDEQIIETIATPRAVDINGEIMGRLGIFFDSAQLEADNDTRAYIRYGPIESLIKGVKSTWSLSTLTFTFLADLLDFSTPADAIGGPVAIAHYAGQAAQAGVEKYLTFLALLSISLGILNLLPIPILDGGHLLFYLYEAITGSPPGQRVMMWGTQIGLVLLLGLMSLAFYNDFINFF